MNLTKRADRRPTGAHSALITEQLKRRPSRTPDFAAEKRALNALACEMATQPKATLRRLVVMVMELCQAGSAGISILEPRGGVEVFCWHAVAGKLGAYVDVVLPREESPSGLVLDSDTTLLFDRLAEHHFRGMKGIEPQIFEALMAPLHKDGRPIGTVWALSHDPDRKFDAEDARLLNNLAQFASTAHQLAAAFDSAEAGRKELERIEDAVHQTQKMEAIGQLTGGMAHDFNNMLQSIGGSLELLLRRVEQGRMPEAVRYIETARNEVERAAVLTHRLLAFARRQTLQPRAVTLDTCITGLAEPIRRAAGRGVKVEFVLNGQAHPVLCDPDQLESALLNFVANARDAMPGGGTLTVATADRTLTAADLFGHDGAKPGGYVEVSVADSGTGMAAHVAARAFEPFFTTKPIGQGAGLGLAQIYGFAQQSGGLARLASVPGQGTTVRLLLPRYVAEIPAVDTPAPPPRRAWDGHDTTVLVVEDEDNVRALVAEALRDQGHTVLEAADGLAGVHVLQSGTRVDLLVTDVGLPGMNGRELADTARVDRPRLPVLLITGYPGAALDAQLAPGMEVLSKPFTLDVLASKARNMVEAAARAADGPSRSL